MMKYFLLPILILSICSCQPNQEVDLEKIEQEIYDVEQAFNELLAAEGRAVAFSEFAAEDGVIIRNGIPIEGKKAIFDFYHTKTSINVKLVWKPDRIEVSDDGSMASTWGKFDYSGQRTNGEKFASQGYFHTVWKRQENGLWRYIYD